MPLIVTFCAARGLIRHYRDLVIIGGSRQQQPQPAAADDVRPRRVFGVPATAIAWAAPFALVLAVLLVRNAFLFTTPEYEDADMGANSILIEQARRFTLLVGHYSRYHFNEPGPRVPVRAGLGRVALLRRAAPGPDGVERPAHRAVRAQRGVRRGGGGGRLRLDQVGRRRRRHAGGGRPARRAAPGRVQLGLDAVRVRAGLPRVRGRDRVGGGRARPGLLAGGAGGLVPDPRLRCLPALRPGAGGRGGGGGPVAPVAGKRLPVFTPGPPSLDSGRGHQRRLRAADGGGAALHWPGNFVKYVTYTSSATSVFHFPVQLVRYLLWFWWPHEHGWAVAVVLAAVAAGATWRLGRSPLRRFCAALLAVDALSTVLFLAYAKDAADALTNYYIGYFYWTAPLLAVLVIALAATERCRGGSRPSPRRARRSPPRPPSPSPRSPGSTSPTSTRRSRRPVS